MRHFWHCPKTLFFSERAHNHAVGYQHLTGFHTRSMVRLPSLFIQTTNAGTPFIQKKSKGFLPPPVSGIFQQNPCEGATAASACLWCGNPLLPRLFTSMAQV